jgi:hypothetical protein
MDLLVDLPASERGGGEKERETEREREEREKELPRLLAIHACHLFRLDHRGMEGPVEDGLATLG